MAESLESFPEAQVQLKGLVAGLQTLFGHRLEAVLLHGSLAMSGFDPQRSDLDVLVILSQPPDMVLLEQLALLMLELSGAPHPLELSVLLDTDLRPWRHPCPHLFHFGEDHRKEFEQGRMAPRQPSDPDLAMHLTVARHRGIDLHGNWSQSKLPEIPEADFLAAVREDFYWSTTRPDDLTDYRLVNACRTLAYLDTGLVLSKTEGVEWCRDQGIEPESALASIRQRLDIRMPDPEPST